MSFQTPADSPNHIENHEQEIQGLDVHMQETQLKSVNASWASKDSTSNSCLQLLICYKCQRLLSNPHTIRCGDTFCAKCLLDVRKQSRIEKVDGKEVEHKEPTYEEYNLLSPKCPKCNKSISFRPIPSMYHERLAANFSARFSIPRSAPMKLEWPQPHPMMIQMAKMRYLQGEDDDDDEDYSDDV
ncbi:hypothetical protein E1B28_009484 [Marasmius oreades]|uniref:RING-type domain-containing protein n=1 Tax=Marasmius oreades TaxID=181124 RepID=A0A9P7USN7_9AGAR|nr:uncharacterized protein E1B28_009484 [Marasmius oreades]KAG7090364.1 hypothetical protein E1B28_009484 [Marasmius oreades]